MSAQTLVDSHGRVLRDLRVSVTDRCNFRCLYCLPETEQAANFYRNRFASGERPLVPGARPVWQPRSELLRFEEIERVVRVAVSLGIEKVRLTGGEPLLRKDLEGLVQRLASIPGLRDLAITTNGFFFAARGEALRRAGLHRVSFSLDALEPATFRKMTGRDGLEEVLASIRLARELGLEPVKVNAVIIRGLNDHEIEPLAAFAARERLSLRFIEFMPLDSGRAWLQELVVSGREILERLQRVFRLVPLASANPSETARRWALEGAGGEIGIIAPVTQPFCGHCNRLRLTADGHIRTCLFSTRDHDLKQVLRGGGSDEDLEAFLHAAVGQKEAGHRIGHSDFIPPNRSMSCIGG